MQDQIEQLFQLQEIELQIRELEKKKQDNPTRLETIRKVMDEISALLEDEKAKSEELMKQKKMKEFDYNVRLQRINQSQEKLHKVKTNKEYQTLLREIDNHKKENSKLENELIELEEAVEAQGRKSDEVHQKLKSKRDELKESEVKITEENNLINVEIEKIIEKTEKYRTGIDTAIFKQYERMKKARNGLAIAMVKNGGICGGCHMALLPQLFNELRADSTKAFRCNNCQRFLLWRG